MCANIDRSWTETILVIVKLSRLHEVKTEKNKNNIIYKHDTHQKQQDRV